jgi:uncharacterized protein YegJ (DUF2314 family)
MHQLARIVLAISVLCSCFANAQTIGEKAERDEVTHMSRQEPAMRQAFQKARASLDEFFKLAAAPAQGTRGYALKVAISDSGGTEHFWVNAFGREGDGFVGTLNNEPRMVKGYKLGQRIKFSESQIADWTYFDETIGRMHGNFTACALLTREPPEQAKRFMQRYGLRCE